MWFRRRPSVKPTDGEALTTGHVFVVRGNITHFACDAWLLPTDARLSIESGWGSATSLRERAARVVPKTFGTKELAFPLPVVDDQPSAIPTAVPLDGISSIQDLVPALEAFFRVAAGLPRSLGHRRDRRLVAIPNFGGRFGGARFKRGALMQMLLETAQAAADRHDLDVVLVLNSAAGYELAQRTRKQVFSRFWPGVNPEYRAAADGLAEDAAAGRLVPFMGAGVSVSAGAPDWSELLRRLAEQASAATPAQRAAVTNAKKWSTLDRATALQVLSANPNDPLAFKQRVAEAVDRERYGLAPALLASLGSAEAITLNYDTLFERAAEDADLPYQVMPGPQRSDGSRWLLKLHGSVTEPASIVLTREDYLGYDEDRNALSSLVKATLMTRRLLFVGFGLADDHFHEIAYDVRRAVKSSNPTASLRATALKLGEPDPIVEAMWGNDLAVVPFVTAEELEIFVDAVLCLACQTHSYLLSPNYEDGLSAAELSLRARLLQFASEITAEERATDAWQVIGGPLRALGSER